jgi:TctA family transporter
MDRGVVVRVSHVKKRSKIAGYFLVAIVALSLLAMASKGKTLVGLALGGIGLLLAFVGGDPITSSSRFTFGTEYLDDGLPLVPVALGLFALSQAFVLAEQGGMIAQIRSIGRIRDGLLETFRHFTTVIRGGIAGIILGVMPALGISSASIMAYLVEKRVSKNPETFGTEIGDSSPRRWENCVIADLIPTFTLGIWILGDSLLSPPSPSGLQPGVKFFRNGALPYAVLRILRPDLHSDYSSLDILQSGLIPMHLSFHDRISFNHGSFAMRNRVEDIWSRSSSAISVSAPQKVIPPSALSWA